MSENASSPMLTRPVGRLMARYAVPCVISLLVAALYNIVDQIFIANAAYLGSYGNAANTAVFPLTVVAPGIAVMIGDGCCAFVSICLDSGGQKRASGHGQFRGGGFVIRHRAHGALSDISGRNTYVFRRTRQRGDMALLQGIFYMDRHGTAFLHVRAGDESHNPLRRQSRFRHDFHAGGRGDQHNTRPDIHILLQTGHDGRGSDALTFIISAIVLRHIWKVLSQPEAV